jgi:hypothetical protein
LTIVVVHALSNTKRYQESSKVVAQHTSPPPLLLCHRTWKKLHSLFTGLRQLCNSHKQQKQPTMRSSHMHLTQAVAVILREEKQPLQGILGLIHTLLRMLLSAVQLNKPFGTGATCKRHQGLKARAQMSQELMRAAVQHMYMHRVPTVDGW